MENVQVLAAKDLRDAALQVTRNLPAAHWWTKFFRQNRFKDSVESFTNAVYEADVSQFKLHDFDLVESAIDIAIHAIEIHLLEHAQSDHAVHRRYYALIEKLRTAREGISRGYPADPSKRPSREDVRQHGMQTLHAVFTDSAKRSHAAS